MLTRKRTVSLLLVAVLAGMGVGRVVAQTRASWAPLSSGGGGTCGSTSCTDLVPATDNASALGSAPKRWSELHAYTVNATAIPGFVPTVTTLTGGTGLNAIGDLSANRTVSIADTAVTPGSYTYSSITVDQQGRLTAASSGAAPALASRTITAAGDLTGGGDLSANRTITLPDTLTPKTLSASVAGTFGLTLEKNLAATNNNKLLQITRQAGLKTFFQLDGSDRLQIQANTGAQGVQLISATGNGIVTADDTVGAKIQYTTNYYVGVDSSNVTLAANGTAVVKIGSGTLGFFNHALVSRPSAYTLNSGSLLRSLPATPTAQECGDTLRQLITDLQGYGLLQ